MDPLLLPVSKSLIQRDFGKPTVTERRALRALRGVASVASQESRFFLLTASNLRKSLKFSQLSVDNSGTMFLLWRVEEEIWEYHGIYTYYLFESPCVCWHVDTSQSFECENTSQPQNRCPNWNNNNLTWFKQQTWGCNHQQGNLCAHTHIYIYIHTYRWLIHLPNIAMNHLKNRAFARTKGNQPNLRTETRWFQSKATRP